MIKRLPFIGLLVACLSSFTHATKDQKSFQVYDFSKGLDSYHAPATLPDGFVQDSQNVLFDDIAPITKRSGYTVAWSTKSYAYTGLWTYTDPSNTTWMIARSSDQITASNLAGTIVKISTMSSNDYIGETNAFGNAYFVDPTQGVYFWNGTSTTYIVGSPKGSIISQFHQRLWVSGAAVPNGNQLYGSKYYDGTTWSTGINATDPVQYSIGLNDNFDNVAALYVYLDTLYLFKHYAIFALYGFDQTNFQISQLTQECGCIDQGTIQTYNGGLKFVSLRGVENFDGYHCTRISDGIKKKLDPAIQSGGFSQQSWILQSQSDWNSGTFNPLKSLNSAVASPALVLSTGSITENTNTGEWINGTTNNVIVGASSITLSTNNSDLPDNSFEGSPNFSSSWVTPNGGPITDSNAFTGTTCGTFAAKNGSWAARWDEPSTQGTWTFSAQIIDTHGTILAQNTETTWANSSCGWVQHTLVVPGSSIGTRAKLRFVDNGTSPVDALDTSFNFLLGGNITFWTASDNTTGSTHHTIWLDLIGGGSSTITTGSFTSQTFDNSFGNYAYISSYVTSNNSAPAFVLQGSANASTWSDIASATNISGLSSRYIRYISTLTVAAADIAIPSLSSININWTASTGTFKSPSHSVSGIGSWGSLSINDTLNSGNIAFSICSSSATTMQTSTCAVQGANAQIVIATNSFANWFATFTVTAATQIPTLNSGTVQWFSGNKAVPMTSTVWDNRYWLSLTTTTTDTANDSILVLNSRGAWADYNIRAGGLTQYKNSLYHADSTGTGNIYLDNQGSSDNGSAINSYIKTKQLSLGELVSDDYLFAVYPSAANTGSCAMSIQYDPDSSGNLMSLGSPLLSEFGTTSASRIPVPVDSTHQVFGQSFVFTVGTNDAICPWNFYGLEGLYKQRPIQ